jgi:hypothetical protein
MRRKQVMITGFSLKNWSHKKLAILNFSLAEQAMRIWLKRSNCGYVKLSPDRRPNQLISWKA